MKLNKILSLSLLLVFFSQNLLATHGESFGFGNEEEIRRLEQQLRELRNRESQVISELNHMESSLRELTRRAERDRREAEQARRDADRLEREERRLTSEVSRLERAVVQARERKQRDIQQAESQVAQIRNEIPSLQSRVQQLDNEVRTLDSQRNPGRISQLQGEISSLRSELQTKEARKRQLENAIADLEKNCHSDAMCLIHINAYRSEINNDLNPRISAISGEVSQREREIEKLNDVERRYQSTLSEKSRAEQTLASKQRELVSAEGSLQEARNRPIIEEQELVRTQQELSQTESELRSAVHREREARRNAEVSQIECDRVARDVSIRQQELRQVQDEIYRVERRIAELKNDNSGGGGPGDDDVVDDEETLPPPIDNSVTRVALVGLNLTTDLDKELQRSGVITINADAGNGQLGFGQASALYILTDTLRGALSASVATSVERFIMDGGLVLVVGNPAKLGTIQTQTRLRTLIGTKTLRNFTSAKLDGSGVLSSYRSESSRTLRLAELDKVSATTVTEDVLTSDGFAVVGKSVKVRVPRGEARILTLGVNVLDIRFEGVLEAEKAFCWNIRSTTEFARRAVCQ